MVLRCRREQIFNDKMSGWNCTLVCWCALGATKRGLTGAGVEGAFNSQDVKCARANKIKDTTTHAHASMSYTDFIHKEHLVLKHFLLVKLSIKFVDSCPVEQLN